MLVTRPSRIAADLLTDHEDPEAVGHLVADAIRAVYDYPSNFADSLARFAAHFGLRRGDGIGLLRWLLDLAGDPDTQRWMDEAHAHVDREQQRGYRAYPLIDHVADKAAATYQRYGDRARPSTRYRDLVDLVAIVIGADMPAQPQMAALGSEFRRRGITLPTRFDIPDRNLWIPGYAAAAADSLLRGARTLDEALTVVRAFLDPLLDGTATGTWDRQLSEWTA